MPSNLLRRVALRCLAAIAVCDLGQALGQSFLEPGGVHVPRFGRGNATDCSSRSRDRIKAVMNGTVTTRAGDRPAARNPTCK